MALKVTVSMVAVDTDSGKEKNSFVHTFNEMDYASFVGLEGLLLEVQQKLLAIAQKKAGNAA